MNIRTGDMTRDESHARKLLNRFDRDDLIQLMVRYQCGDPDAAVELFTRLRPRLYRFFSNSHVTRPHAEDLLQEFWIRLHKARRSYRPGAPVLPWVYAIARYTLIDGQRRLSRPSQERDIEAVAVPRATASSVDLAMDLRRAIDKLPVKQRKVFLMLKVSGLSLRETARSIGSSVGAVKQMSHRAYVGLRSSLHGQNDSSKQRRRYVATIPSIGNG